MNVKSAFIFDVDGTLTRPRQQIETIHDFLFRKVCKVKPTYILTGSSWEMLCEQIPKTTLYNCAGVYTCLGNVLHRQGQLVYKNEHSFDKGLIFECEKFVHGSLYGKKFGNHIEERVGMLNVSSVGRSANNDERLAYSTWDKKEKERFAWVEKIEKQFPNYDFSVGGSISIDIAPKGRNKSQILKDFGKDVYIEFYGDKMSIGGNDYPLKVALEKRGAAFSMLIKNYRTTYVHIKNILEVGF